MGTIKYSRKIKVLIFLKYCCKVDPLMEDEFYNVLLDWNAPKIGRIIGVVRKIYIKKKNFWRKKNGPLKPEKGEKEEKK